MKELLQSNSIIAANKRRNNLHQLIARADPYNIKTDFLDQTPHGYKKCGRKCDSYDNFVLEDTSFICLNLEFAEIVFVIPKTLYI